MLVELVRDNLISVEEAAKKADMEKEEFHLVAIRLGIELK